MTIVNTDTLSIPKEVENSWQRLVNVVADITGAPHSMIMRANSRNQITIFCTNQIDERRRTQFKNGYVDNKTHEQSVAACKQLLQEGNNRLHSDCHKPLFTLSPTFSFLGTTLRWPDGSVFGVICLVDNKSNSYSLLFQSLLMSYKETVEAQLTIIYQQIKLLKLNSQLKQRVKRRTEDLATLNYSLTQEIDKRKEAEQEVLYQKNHDLSTGFLNYQSMSGETNQLLKQIKNTESKLVIFHITFTNGRKIQERFGEQVLSDLLKAFRERIGHFDCVCSLTARTSISNIIIAIQSTKLSPFIDNFSQRLVDVAHSEFRIKNENVHLHAFIGVATSENSNDAKQILFFANEAAFSCKETGQRYSYYSQAENEVQKQRNEIESYLLEAVRNDDLILYFQPKVELKTGEWIGAEALIRWNHPILGSVSNENLIQMAEQNGLIFEVGNFVLRTAIEHATQWAPKLENFKIAVNVSPVQLKNQLFFEHLEHLLDTYHLPAHCLEIEITESALISNEYLAKKTLTKLHNLGVTLSLDDFGTGYASFSYLKSYPFNCIKIDKSFIQNIASNQDDREIVHSIVQIAKRLELDVTIEGIEDINQERFVINEGCDYAQGYLYGKPMTGKEFENFIIK